MINSRNNEDFYNAIFYYIYVDYIQYDRKLKLKDQEILSRNFYEKLIKLKNRSQIKLKWIDYNHERGLIRAIYENIDELEDILSHSEKGVFTVNEFLNITNKST